MHIIHITYHMDTTHTYHMHSYQITCHHIAHVYGSCTSYSHTSHTPTTYTHTTYHHILNYEVGPETSKKKISFSLFLPFPQPPSPRFLFPKLEAGGQPHRLPCGSFLSLLQTGNLRDNDGSNFSLFQEMSSSFNEWKSPSRGSVTGRDKASSKWHPVQLLPAAATLGSP